MISVQEISIQEIYIMSLFEDYPHITESDIIYYAIQNCDRFKEDGSVLFKNANEVRDVLKDLCCHKLLESYEGNENKIYLRRHPNQQFDDLALKKVRRVFSRRKFVRISDIPRIAGLTKEEVEQTIKYLIYYGEISQIINDKFDDLYIKTTKVD